MISSLIGFLTSPLGIALIIGAFSGGARLWAKMQEQRAKQTQIQARRQMERDALRTGGRGMSEPRSTPAPPSTWDQDQQSKRDRIEELRRRRIEQLQKLREQRSGASSAQTSAAPIAPAPAPTPRRAPQQPQPARRGPQRAAPPPPAPARRPAPQPAPAARQTTRAAPKPQPTPRRAPSRAPTPRPAPVSQPEHTTISDLPKPAPVAVRQDRSRFATRQALRDAIIAKEVLGPPVALRQEHASDPFSL